MRVLIAHGGYRDILTKRPKQIIPGRVVEQLYFVMVLGCLLASLKDSYIPTEYTSWKSDKHIY